MLQKIFVSIIFIVLIVVFAIIKNAIPGVRFMIMADEICELYDIVKVILNKDILGKRKVEISHGKYNLKCSNVNELSVEFEKIVNEVLEAYDKLGQITIVNGSFKEKRDKLINIIYEIKILNWKKQGT